MRRSSLFGGAAAITSAVLMIGGSGCATQGGAAAGFAPRRSADAASRRLANADLGMVRPVADRVFRTYFRTDQEGSSRHEWVSRPEESDEPAGPTRVRDMFTAFPNRRRRVAALWLGQDGPHVVARCRILIQRLDTTERAAFAPQRGDDRPTATPIDRHGPASTSTREEWVDVGRDRSMEQEILTAIERELTSATRPAG